MTENESNKLQAGDIVRCDTNMYCTLVEGDLYTVQVAPWCGNSYKIMVKNISGRMYEYPCKVFTSIDAAPGCTKSTSTEPLRQAKDKLLGIKESMEKLRVLEAQQQKLIAELEKPQSKNVVELAMQQNGNVDSDMQSLAVSIRKVLKMYSHTSSFQIRQSGELAGKGLYLSPQYKWEIINDSNDGSILVITLK